MSDKKQSESVASSAVPQPSLTRALELASRIYDIFSSYQRSEVNIHLCQFEIAKIIDAELRRDCGAVPQASTEMCDIHTFCRKGTCSCPPSRGGESAVPQAIDKKRFEQAPCYLCGYNGARYFQPDTHSCAKLYHEVPLCRRGHKLTDHDPHGCDFCACEKFIACSVTLPIAESALPNQPQPERPLCETAEFSEKAQQILEEIYGSPGTMPQPGRGQPERPERCPNCTSPKREERWVRYRCGRTPKGWIVNPDDAYTIRCDDSWHDPAAAAPQIVHAPQPERPERCPTCHSDHQRVRFCVAEGHEPFCRRGYRKNTVSQCEDCVDSWHNPEFERGGKSNG